MSEPFQIAIITGSPSQSSRGAALAVHIERRLTREAFRVRTIHVRDLPAQALLHADTSAPELAEAQAVLARADGVIFVSPVYKAAYSGVLKAFIDLLPQFALRGKVVLPLLTGGTLAHVLALDYGLRPVLQSLDPKQILAGLFLLDKWLTVQADGDLTVEEEAQPRVAGVVQSFIDALRAVSP